MKKSYLKWLFIASIVCLFASCDTKTCYCYNYTYSGILESEEIVDSDKNCRSLSRGMAGEYGSRACVESNERVPSGDIAWK